MGPASGSFSNTVVWLPDQLECSSVWDRPGIEVGVVFMEASTSVSDSPAKNINED